MKKDNDELKNEIIRLNRMIERMRILLANYRQRIQTSERWFANLHQQLQENGF